MRLGAEAFMQESPETVDRRGFLIASVLSLASGNIQTTIAAPNITEREASAAIERVITNLESSALNARTLEEDMKIVTREQTSTDRLVQKLCASYVNEYARQSGECERIRIRVLRLLRQLGPAARCGFPTVFNVKTTSVSPEERDAVYIAAHSIGMSPEQAKQYCRELFSADMSYERFLLLIDVLRDTKNPDVHVAAKPLLCAFCNKPPSDELAYRSHRIEEVLKAWAHQKNAKQENKR